MADASRIFLCHANEDKPQVRQVYQWLKEAGYHPWLDEEDILPGMTWDQETRKALRNSGLVLIFFSQNSVNKRGYVQREFKISLDVMQELPEDEIFVVPIRLDDCSIPDQFSHLQYLDLFSENGYPKLSQTLERTFERSPAIPPPSPAEVSRLPGNRGVNIGGDVSGSTIITGDGNVVGHGNTVSGRIPTVKPDDKKPKTTILFMAANPVKGDPLRLDREMREIDEGLRLAKYRDQFNLEQKWAVRVRDFRRSILDHEPQIIHFSGHGVKGGATGGGIMLEHDQGGAVVLNPGAVAGLFRILGEEIDIHCVVLNACYSEPQARAIAESVPYVIGMKDALDDRAAIEFSIGFYDGIGAGKGVPTAFRLGKNAVDLLGTAAADDLVLLIG